MAREQVIKLVERLVEEIIQGTELSLVEVEYVKERDWYLRVFLDKAGGVEVEDCQWVSERLEAKLDELDPIQGSYYLEVSSPGLDRPLKNEKDFVRHQGEKVEVHLYSPLDGEKLIVGALQGLIDNQVALILDNGQEKQISRDKISLVRLYIDF